MPKPVLGKGLSALISRKPEHKAQPSPETSGAPAEESGERIIQAKANDIQASPFQPRRKFSDEQIRELADSIRERGLIQPLIVRIVNGKYELIAGERRLRAIKSLGIEDVSVVIHQASDQEVAELTLIENLQREDLSPLEEEQQTRVRLTRINMKQDTIARHGGKSRAHIANMVRLLELEEDVRELLEESKITVGHAKVLLQLKDPARQISAAQRVVSHSLTVRQTEQLVRKILNPEPAPQPKDTQLPEAYRQICNELSREFGTRVNIALKGKSNGIIEIPYSGKDELERILQLCGISSAHLS